jgi:arylsulfatase A-like enzyme
MKQPNIIMIMIDDLGARDLGCFGSSFYETPHLDRLAKGGLKFDNAYASCPACSPTRASLLSGKYPARVGITQWIGGLSEGKLKDVPYLHYLPLEETSIATALKNGGYQTWHVGKWHLGDEGFLPENHGFDVNIGGCHWGAPEGKGRYFSPFEMHNLPDREGEPEYLTDRLTEEAIGLIDGRTEAPFFLNLSHYAVHTPIMAPAHLIKKYEAKAAALGLDKIDPIVRGESFSCVHKSDQFIERRVIQSHAGYAAMIENLDTNIGKLMNHLDAKGLREDTLIAFTSDNGGLATAESSPTCNLPLTEGKGWNKEGGTRVCQIMNWPRTIAAGGVSTTNVQTCDFYPTFLEVAGLALQPDQHVDGVSLMQHIKGGQDLERQSIFWHYPHYSNQGGCPAASMVHGKWKLIRYFEDDSYELFDLETDVSETQNLTGKKSENLNHLKRELNHWIHDIEAKIPEFNEGWQKKMKRPSIENNAHI